MDARTLASGFVLGGDFVVAHKLADGGMGTVYLCHQRSTGQERAVKVFSAEFVVDADLRRRFVQESQIAARIASEHIAVVVAAGIEQHLPWLAMELLQGETLSARVARAGPLDRPAARALFQQLGHALVAAHDAQIAHRDLKPDNIFLARSRHALGESIVKVLDFGVAKVVDSGHAHTTSMTFGTPLWMAPEQLLPGEAGKGCDVWALGLVAFFALTGRIYWRGANTDPHDVGAVVAERCAPARDGTPTRPPAGSRRAAPVATGR